MQEFLICEVESSNSKKSVFYGFPTENFIGISSEFIENIPEFPKNSIGGAVYNQKIYPVFNYFEEIEKPLLKIFLVYQDFAIGVTRVVTRLFVDELIEARYRGNLKGMFYFENEKVYALNLDKLKGNLKDYSAIPLKLANTEKSGKTLKERLTEEFVVLDKENLAVNLKDIDDIVEVEKMCCFNFDEFSGFVSKRNGEILAVKSVSENGRWILITKSGKAFQVSNLTTAKGEIVKNKEGESFVLYEGKNYKIL